MNHLLKEIRHNPLLWLLALVPVVLVTAKLKPRRTPCSSSCQSWRLCHLQPSLVTRLSRSRPRQGTRSAGSSTPPWAT